MRYLSEIKVVIIMAKYIFITEMCSVVACITNFVQGFVLFLFSSVFV